MRLLILAIAVIAWLPVYGQNEAPKAKNEQQHAESRENPKGQSATPLETRDSSSVDKPATQSREDRQSDQADSYFKSLISPNNLPNGILALVGIFGVCVAIRTLNWLKQQTQAIQDQAVVMRDQFLEFRESNASAKAFNHGSLARLEQQGLLMAQQTDLIKRQVTLMEGQLQEMQEAGKRAIEQLRLTERPWISPVAQLVGPLEWDANGVHVKIRVHLTNVGESPALAVWVAPMLYFKSQRKLSSLEAQRVLCEAEGGKRDLRWVPRYSLAIFQATASITPLALPGVRSIHALISPLGGATVSMLKACAVQT